MSTPPSFESVLNEIRAADRRNATLVRRAFRDWFKNNAPDVEELVIFETDKGTGVQALITSSGHAIDLEQLENLNQLGDLVFFYAANIVDQHDYDWDDDYQRIWKVTVKRIASADDGAP